MLNNTSSKKDLLPFFAIPEVVLGPFSKLDIHYCAQAFLGKNEVEFEKCGLFFLPSLLRVVGSALTGALSPYTQKQ